MTDRTGRRTAEVRRLYHERRIRDQRVFYADRCQEYTIARDQAATARNAMLWLAALAGLAGLFVGSGGKVALGLAAAVLAALAGAVTGFEALIGFDNLTTLYGDALANLEHLEIDWEESPGVDLVAEVERVEQVFELENGQWGQLRVNDSHSGGQ